MATVLELRVPADQFALASTFASVSTLRIEIEQCVAQNSESEMPFVWVTTDEFEEFEAALTADPTVEEFSLVADFGRERFYWMNWIEEVDLVVHLLIEEDCTVTSAGSDGESWHLRVMCPDREVLSRTYKLCEENGLSVTVDSIYELDSNEGSQFGLTEPQRTTLLKAQEFGYYDVPRSVSLCELADILDISHQALSERLRRAHSNLIAQAMSVSRGEQEESPTAPLG